MREWIIGLRNHNRIRYLFFFLLYLYVKLRTTVRMSPSSLVFDLCQHSGLYQPPLAGATVSYGMGLFWCKEDWILSFQGSCPSTHRGILGLFYGLNGYSGPSSMVNISIYHSASLNTVNVYHTIFTQIYDRTSYKFPFLLFRTNLADFFFQCCYKIRDIEPVSTTIVLTEISTAETVLLILH